MVPVEMLNKDFLKGENTNIFVVNIIKELKFSCN